MTKRRNNDVFIGCMILITMVIIGITMFVYMISDISSTQTKKKLGYCECEGTMFGNHYECGINQRYTDTCECKTLLNKSGLFCIEELQTIEGKETKDGK